MDQRGHRRRRRHHRRTHRSGRHGNHVLPYLVQHNKRYYADPESFDPDRWSPERAADIDKKANLSFGVGRRRCLGDHFAMIEIGLAAAALLARWRPTPDPNYTVRASIETSSFLPQRCRLRCNRVEYLLGVHSRSLA